VDGGFEIIRHQQPRNALEELEHAHMSADPIGQRLRPARRGEGVVRGAEHGDEEFDGDDLAGGRIDQRRPLPRVVDKRLLARRVDLAHRGPLLRQPAPVVPAERRIPVAVRMGRQIFEMQELQRDARAPQFGVHPDQIGPWPGDRQRQLRPVQRPLQGVVAERADGVPSERHRLRPSHHRGDRARTDPQTPGRLPVTPS